MYCSKCGTANLDTSRFCRHCGSCLSDSPQQSQTPPHRVQHVVSPIVVLPADAQNGFAERGEADRFAAKQVAAPGKDHAASNLKSKTMERIKGRSTRTGALKTAYKPLKAGAKAQLVLWSTLLTVFYLSALFFSVMLAIAPDLSNRDVELFLNVTAERLFGSPFVLLACVLLSALMMFNIVNTARSNLRTAVLSIGISTVSAGIISVVCGMLGVLVIPRLNGAFFDALRLLQGSFKNIFVSLGIVVSIAGLALVSSYASVCSIKKTVRIRSKERKFPLGVVVNTVVLIACIGLLAMIVL